MSSLMQEKSFERAKVRSACVSTAVDSIQSSNKRVDFSSLDRIGIELNHSLMAPPAFSSLYSILMFVSHTLCSVSSNFLTSTDNQNPMAHQDSEEKGQRIQGEDLLQDGMDEQEDSAVSAPETRDASTPPAPQAITPVASPDLNSLLSKLSEAINLFFQTSSSLTIVVDSIKDAMTRLDTPADYMNAFVAFGTNPLAKAQFENSSKLIPECKEILKMIQQLTNAENITGENGSRIKKVIGELEDNQVGSPRGRGHESMDEQATCKPSTSRADVGHDTGAYGGKYLGDYFVLMTAKTSEVLQPVEVAREALRQVRTQIAQTNNLGLSARIRFWTKQDADDAIKRIATWPLKLKKVKDWYDLTVEVKTPYVLKTGAFETGLYKQLGFIKDGQVIQQKAAEDLFMWNSKLFDSRSDIEKVGVYPIPRTGKHVIEIHVSATAYEKITTSQGVLSLDTSVRSLALYVNRREQLCFNCKRPGHFARDCNEQKSTCQYCSEDHEEPCPVEFKPEFHRCRNCQEYNSRARPHQRLLDDRHALTSTNCTLLRKKNVNQARRRFPNSKRARHG